MANITPTTNIKLYRKVAISTGQQILFKTKAEQTAYFNKKHVKTVDKCTYQRKQRSIKIEALIKDVEGCNYLSFINPSFENTIFYGRVYDIEYVNNNTVEIRYEIDPFQTYMFDFEINKCVVDREHLSESDMAKATANPYRNDVPMLFTEEPLATGRVLEGIVSMRGNSTDMSANQDSKANYNVKSLFPTNSGNDATAGAKNGGSMIWSTHINCILFVFSAAFNDPEDRALLKDLILKTADRATTTSNLDGSANTSYMCIFFERSASGDDVQARFRELLDYMTLHAMTSGIVGIYTVPYFLLTHMNTGDGTFNPDDFRGTKLDLNSSDPSYVGVQKSGTFPTTSEFTIPINPPKLSDLGVKNPKLLRFPYSYIRANSQAHDVKEYYYERFGAVSATTPGTGYIRVVANYNGIPTLILAPFNYNMPNTGGSGGITNWGSRLNFQESMVFAGFPQVAYATDGFLTYLGNQYAAAMENLGQYSMNKREVAINQMVENVKWGTTTAALQGALGGAMAGGGAGALVGGVANTGLSIMNGVRSVNQEIERQMVDVEMFKEAEAAAASHNTTSAMFGGVGSSFVSDNYIGSRGVGFAPIQMEQEGFMVQNVGLKKSVLQKYDDWFTAYGYACNEARNPRVYNYIKGTGEQPSFMNNENGIPSTFVRTATINIISVDYPTQKVLEALFNAGLTLLKGSALS